MINKSRNTFYSMVFGVWGDNEPLDKISSQLGLNCENSHYLGKPIVISDKIAPCMAKRHFVSMEKLVTENLEDLEIWLSRIIVIVEKAPIIINMLQSNT